MQAQRGKTRKNAGGFFWDAFELLLFRGFHTATIVCITVSRQLPFGEVGHTKIKLLEN
jgi:hypothetical protein